jgi:hypothetical protein
MSRDRRPSSAWRWAAAAVAMILAFAPAGAKAGNPPERSLAAIDEQFSAAAVDLVRRCRLSGLDELAALIAGWPLPAAAGRQFALAIPAAAEPPAVVANEEAHAIWSDFLAARRARAEDLFAHAVFAASRHDRLPTRADLARPTTGNEVSLSQRSCEAIRLVYLALRDDPAHARAREAAGWVRRGDRWEWPAAARRSDRAAEYDPQFGWVPKGRLARLREAKRDNEGRDDEATTTTDLRRAPQFDSDHWEIVSTAPRPAAAELAVLLETTRLIWLQIFGGFALEPAELERRLAGRSRLQPETPHSAVLCGSRDQYVAELERLEPRIAISDGLYWQPTRTIWCYAAPTLPARDTVRHETAHQLFAESRPDILRMRSEPGMRSGFWAVEAAALYAESIAEAPFGWTLGGRDRGRAPAARRQLVEDELFVPLAELSALGRAEFQADLRLPQLYDQCGGLADFFMNAHDGRYREPFVEYLVRVYSGTAQPDSLFRLCGRSGPELDAEYRTYITASSDPD